MVNGLEETQSLCLCQSNKAVQMRHQVVLLESSMFLGFGFRWAQATYSVIEILYYLLNYKIYFDLVF